MTQTLSTKQRRSVRLTAIVLAVVVLGLFTAIFLTAVNAKPDLKATLSERDTLLFDTPRLLPEVTLVLHDGRPFVSADFVGKWNVVTFGYTFCPDICPTNMADMNIAHKMLTEAGLAEQIQFWMVTVDPARDSAEQLSKYVPYFNESFLGLTGEADQIATLSMQLSAVYYQEGEGEGYTVAHSDNFAIINPDGHFVALLRPPHQPATVNEVMTLLLQHY